MSYKCVVCQRQEANSFNKTVCTPCSYTVQENEIIDRLSYELSRIRSKLESQKGQQILEAIEDLKAQISKLTE